VLARWPATAPTLLTAALVEQFIPSAYQASLLQEEGYPVRYRLLFMLTNAQHVLALAVPRPYDK
jgi:hypothetical protein